MPNAQQPLPSFDDPPVIETILGVEFAALERWQIPHFGLFWEKLRAEYPTFEIQPPIVSDDNRTVPDFLQAMMIDVISSPPIRCWYKHESETRLLQVQQDRFVHNWRKAKGGVSYPRYKAIKPMFEREWTRFAEFLAQEKIGTPEPTRCEVSYVNHLAREKEETTIADLSRIFPFWSGMTSTGTPLQPNAFNANFSIPMPDDNGQLTVQIHPAVRRSDRKQILQFTLSAKGQPRSGSLADILAWFDLGRDMVVRSFCALTTPEMHQLWGQKE